MLISHSLPWNRFSYKHRALLLNAFWMCYKCSPFQQSYTASLCSYTWGMNMIRAREKGRYCWLHSFPAFLLIYLWFLTNFITKCGDLHISFKFVGCFLCIWTFVFRLYTGSSNKDKRVIHPLPKCGGKSS